MISKLRDGELDAVLCAGAPPSGLHSHRIASERLMLVGRRDGVAGEDRPLAWDEIPAHDLTFDQSPLGATLRALSIRHMTGPVAAAPKMLLVERYTLLRLIAANDGVTILPEVLTAGLPPPLAARPIRNARLGIFMIWPAGRRGSLLRMLLGGAGALRPE